MTDVAAETPEKRKRLRSPAYPYINLENAIQRAREFYAKEGRNPANIRIAAKHWGYEEKSSGGSQTAAALISFGLMKDEGTGDRRNLQLTPAALRILLDSDPESLARTEAIKTVALAPKIHQELWTKWGNTPPSDMSLKNILTLEWEPPFNDNAVDGFIREYRDTIAFAKLSDADTLEPEVIDKADESNEQSNGKTYIPTVGDYVQWESGGVWQFKEPRRITRFSTDGKFAFVEGSNTGAPIWELTKRERPDDPIIPPATRIPPARTNANPSPQKAKMREDVFSVAEGNVIFQWPSPLSADSIADLKDWLKILERKISRPTPAIEKGQSDDNQG